MSAAVKDMEHNAEFGKYVKRFGGRILLSDFSKTLIAESGAENAENAYVNIHLTIQKCIFEILSF